MFISSYSFLISIMWLPWRFAFLFALLFFLACLSFASARPSRHGKANLKTHKYNGIKSTKSTKSTKLTKLDNSISCNGSPANCNLPLMQGYIFPGTHNSATARLQPDAALGITGIARPISCTTECQSSTVAQQFQDGIRAFHFEVCDAGDAEERDPLFVFFQNNFAQPVPSYSSSDPVICHGTDPLWGYGPLLSIVFQDLQRELMQSNNQVIRIVIEFRQGDTNVLLNRTVELFTNIFCGGDPSCPVAIQFSELYNKNPTLGSLTANITNRILFTNPALTYYPTDGTLPAAPSEHYTVPWVLQDYLACNYDSGSNITEVLSHQQALCKSNAATSLCTYYGSSDQISYLKQVPWKIQGQIGFSVDSLESIETCLIDYATVMNSNNGIVSSIPVCQANKNNVGQVEVDYYNKWNGNSNTTAFIGWINQLNYNTSTNAPWGNVY